MTDNARSRNDITREPSRRARFESRIEFVLAKTLDALPQLGGQFDLAYIDAVKGDGLADGIKL